MGKRVYCEVAEIIIIIIIKSLLTQLKTTQLKLTHSFYFVDLQSSTSNHGHPTKFFISFSQHCHIFLKTFWWLPFKLANQNAGIGGGGVIKRHVDFLSIDNSGSHSP